MSHGYEPNPLLGWALARLFASIDVDPAWVTQIRAAAARGRVVYVLRNLSFVDFLALDHLTKRFDLPRVAYVSDLGLFLFEPLGRGWLTALARRARPVDDSRELARVVAAGSSAALFLRRPTGALSGHRGGVEEGDAFLLALLKLQASEPRPILLCPQVFLWARNDGQPEGSLVDALFGSQEWPGKLRTLAQFAANYRDVTLRAANPLDLRAFQAEHAGLSAATQVRRVTYALLRRLERERRSVVGPADKPRDRVREDVLRSPRLQAVIRDLAGPGAQTSVALTGRARRMLAAMESAPNRASLGALSRVFDATLARMYPKIEVDERGLAELRECARKGVLVLLPSHRSHVDYILMTRVCLEGRLPVPRVAAGDNLNFFPLGAVLRRGGAFFIRRKFAGDRLYSAVVDAYLRRLLRDGQCLEFYLEGGRSRTGKLLAPKLGLLSMVVDAARATSERTVYFCPVSIAYERMVEEQAIRHEVRGGDKRAESVSGLGDAAQKVFGQYGTASVQFATPFTLAELGHDPQAPLTQPKRRALIQRVAYRTLREMNRVTAATPGALAAAALLTGPARGIDHEALLATCTQIAQLLRARGARLSESLSGSSYDAQLGIERALELFERAGYLRIQTADQRANRNWRRRFGARITRASSAQPRRAGPGALHRIRESGRLGLDYAKNNLMHFFVEEALVAGAFASETRVASAELSARVESLSRLFKYEFSFRNDVEYAEVLASTLHSMLARNEVRYVGADIELVASAATHFYRSLLITFLEGYRVAARALRELLRGDLPESDWIRKTLALGERMHLTGVIARPEAVSKSIIECAAQSFEAQGYLARSQGTYALTESFRSLDAIAAAEAKVAYFLQPTAAEATSI